MIVVLNAHDVVFAEIGAGLHLDQLEVDPAGIVHPVPHRSANRSNSFSCTKWIACRGVTRAVPPTTIQCSER